MVTERRVNDWTGRISRELLRECEGLYDEGATYLRIKCHLMAAGYSVGASSVARWAAKRRREKLRRDDPALVIGRAVVKLLVEQGLYVGVKQR